MPVALLVPLERLDSSPFMIFRAQNDVDSENQQNCLIEPNKLTRIVEDVFVFCRKDEYKTFQCNKEVSSVGKTGQTFYKIMYNFIEAPNNDGSCILNKATYSSELCEKLLTMYANNANIVYDPFMGTGTTGIACKELGYDFIGIELDENYFKLAKERINNA